MSHEVKQGSTSRPSDVKATIPNHLSRLPTALEIKDKKNGTHYLISGLRVLILVTAAIREIENRKDFKQSQWSTNNDYGFKIKPNSKNLLPWLNAALELKDGEELSTQEKAEKTCEEFINNLKRSGLKKISRFNNDKQKYKKHVDEIIFKKMESKEKHPYKKMFANKINLFCIGNNIIAITSPGRRYADAWGKHDTFIKDFEFIKQNLPKEIKLTDEDTESSIGSRDGEVRLSNGDIIDYKLLRRNISRLYNQDIRDNNTRRIVGQKLQKKYEKLGGPGYGKIRKEIQELLHSASSITEIEIIIRMRACLLNLGNTDKIIAILTATWFLCEASKNPTSFISSLIVLDFIQGQQQFETATGNQNFSFHNVLWDTDMKWGGHHPMCHKGSYSPEFEDPNNRWYQQSTAMSNTRRKEAALLIRWLSWILPQEKYEIHIQTDEKFLYSQDPVSSNLEKEIVYYFQRRTVSGNYVMTSLNKWYNEFNEPNLQENNGSDQKSSEPLPQNQDDPIQDNISPASLLSKVGSFLTSNPCMGEMPCISSSELGENNENKESPTL